MALDVAAHEPERKPRVRFTSSAHVAGRSLADCRRRCPAARGGLRRGGFSLSKSTAAREAEFRPRALIRRSVADARLPFALGAAAR